MKSIISFIGARGSGKTTVGGLIAKRLSWEFYDSDYEIERQTGITIREYFENNKVKEFREAEAKILADALNKNNIIIATGGGCLEREDTRNVIKCNGFCVWLKAEPLVLLERLKNAPRPPLTTLSPLKEVEFILAQRMKLYSEIAKFAVETDALTPDEVCDAVQRAWQIF